MVWLRCRIGDGLMLANRMIAGAAAGVVSASITFETSVPDNANETNYTFTSVDIGSAAADRQVLVGVGIGADSRTFSSVKIHVPTVAADPTGTTMTSLIDVTTTGGFDRAGLFIATVASGTSAEIVVTTSGANGRCGLAVWSVNGAASTANDTLSSTASPMTGTIDCSAGGVIVAYAFPIASGAGRTFTWAGVTEDFDEAVDGGNNTMHTGASEAFDAVQTGLTVSCTASASLSRQIMVAVSLDAA